MSRSGPNLLLRLAELAGMMRYVWCTLTLGQTSSCPYRCEEERPALHCGGVQSLAEDVSMLHSFPSAKVATCTITVTFFLNVAT